LSCIKQKEPPPMRHTIHKQLPIVSNFIDHEHAEELNQMSQVLDSFGLELSRMVYEDLIRDIINPEKGRPGMTAEQVLRALVIKQMRGFSYEQLEFHLKDSTSYKRFCRYGIADEPPSISALKRNLKLVTAETLEAINRKLLGYALDRGIEDGSRIRTDCTVEETNIHKPSDSHLLYDSVRVLARLMARVSDDIEGLAFTDHRRRAKRRWRNIEHTGKESERVKFYRDLIQITEKTVQYAFSVVTSLEQYESPDVFEYCSITSVIDKLKHYGLLAQKVIDQTKRRVLYGETVPSDEKVVSIFEPHTDIIIKSRRDTFFGHKLCLTTGQSALVLDCVVEDGNPADSKLAVEMVERVSKIYNAIPCQAAFDGGFASRENLVNIKELGVQDVVFNKKCGLEVSQMASSSWVYRYLSNFRAGIEGGISFLKRCFGLSRCMWKGLASYKSYTWASILSHNLMVLARHRLC
jgi:transposase, IS5 family